jgi:hypothetical protein
MVPGPTDSYMGSDSRTSALCHLAQIRLSLPSESWKTNFTSHDSEQLAGIRQRHIDC